MAFYFWLFIGVILIGLELLIPGVVLVFFGAGSILVSLLVLIIPMPLSIQIIVMLGSSIAALVFFRKKLVDKYLKKDFKIEFEGELGQKVQVIKTIKPGLLGIVELHGSPWKAEAHQNDLEIPQGNWVIIRGRKNLVLIVEPLK